MFINSNKNKSHSKKELILIFLLGLLVLSIPLNLFLKISEEGSFVNGLQIDYLITKIHLSDLLLALLLVTWVGISSWEKVRIKINETNIFTQKNESKFLIDAINKRIKNFKFVKNLKKIYPLLIVFLAIATRQVFSAQPKIGFYFLLNIGVVALFGFFLYKHSAILKSKYIAGSVIISYLIQLFLGTYQFFAQKPLLPYRYLGEPRFEPYYRLSRHIFSGKERILAYGSTAHPNLLATVGVLFFLIIATNIKKSFKQKEDASPKRFNLSIIFLTLFFASSIFLIYITQAKTVLITLFFGSLFIFKDQINLKISNNFKKWSLLAVLTLAPIILTVMSSAHSYNPSIVRRNFLNIAAIEMILDQPLIGHGLNHFTLHLENFSQSLEVTRFVQPAHHVGLLWLAETGLLGLVMLILLYKGLFLPTRSRLLSALFIISPLLAMDHFFYSLQSGRLLFIFFVMWWINVFEPSQNN